MKRARDRWAAPATLAGFGLLLAAAGLDYLDRGTERTIHIMLVLGAGLISPAFLIDLVRAWRSKNGATTAPPAPPTQS